MVWIKKRSIFWEFFPNPETFQTARKLSRLSRNFPDCPETFQTVRKLSKLSGNFPDCPETFQTVRKLSRLSRNFPDCPETFQTVRKLSRQSGNFPDSCSVLNWFKGQFCLNAQKLSGRAKTFRLAMPTRQPCFSASGEHDLRSFLQNSHSLLLSSSFISHYHLQRQNINVVSYSITWSVILPHS